MATLLPDDLVELVNGVGLGVPVELESVVGSSEVDQAAVGDVAEHY